MEYNSLMVSEEVILGIKRLVDLMSVAWIDVLFDGFGEGDADGMKGLVVLMMVA